MSHNPPFRRTTPSTQRNHNMAKADKAQLSRAEALRRVEKALTELEYGTIEIKVEGGVPIWVLKHVRERVG